MKALKVVLFTLALSSIALANGGGEGGGIVVGNAVPEIDGASAASAVALVAGGLMVLRARRK